MKRVMKKTLSLLLAVSALCIPIFISSCSAAADPAHIDTGFLTEEYRKTNITAFYNPDCKHDIRYLPAASVDKNYPDAEYHYVYCVYGNCDFEGRFEKHSDTLILRAGRGSGRIMANGIKYHEINLFCPVCGLFYMDETGMPIYPIKYYVVCKNQDGECGSVYDCRGWTSDMEITREELGTE